MADRAIYAGDDIDSGFLRWRVAKHVSSPFAFSAGGEHGDKDVANTYKIFDVTGDVIVKLLWGICNTNLAGAATLDVGVVGQTDAFMVQVNPATDLDDGDVWLANIDTSGATAVGAGKVNAVTYQWTPINDGANIIETTGTADITGGQIDYYCIWAACEPGASVIPAPQNTLSQV